VEARLESEKAALAREIDRWTDELGKGPSRAVSGLLRTAEQRLVRTSDDLAKVRLRLRVHGVLARPLRLRELSSALRAGKAVEASAKLRALFRSVTIDWRTHVLLFEWHQGGQTSVPLLEAR
jgi:hypothetical protein